MFDLWSKKIKIDEKSYKNILIFHIEYVMVKNLNSITINSVNPLYIVINKINDTLKKVMEKDSLKGYEELWKKIRDLIKSIINNSDNYDDKYMKIKFRWRFTSKENARTLQHGNNC